jgi:hypothetical protein
MSPQKSTPLRTRTPLELDPPSEIDVRIVAGRIGLQATTKSEVYYTKLHSIAQHGRHFDGRNGI